jgi:hypothetical protein
VRCFVFPLPQVASRLDKTFFLILREGKIFLFLFLKFFRQENSPL